MENFEFDSTEYRVFRSENTKSWTLLQADSSSSTGWILKTTLDRGIYDYDIVSRAKAWLRDQRGDFHG